VLVGCGAAGRHRAAPSTRLYCGAFYGIELIIGVYSMATLPFVVIAALCGTLMVQILIGWHPAFERHAAGHDPSDIYPIVLALGFASGLAGIVDQCAGSP